MFPRNSVHCSLLISDVEKKFHYRTQIKKIEFENVDMNAFKKTLRPNAHFSVVLYILRAAADLCHRSSNCIGCSGNRTHRNRIPLKAKC